MLLCMFSLSVHDPSCSTRMLTPYSTQPAPACPTVNLPPKNITSPTTCLCCTSSSPLTYISTVSPTQQFHLNCSSNLAPSSGTQSLDLNPGSVTSSFALCMDMCVAWNRDQDLIEKEGSCGGVTWLVQTGSASGGNLLCTLKRRGAAWKAWEGGSKGLSALLNR